MGSDRLHYIFGRTLKCTKYDGKVLPVSGQLTGADQVTYVASDGTWYLSIPITDSGWGDSYTPTADEIKAYFMGWRMYDGSVEASQPYNRTDGLNKYWTPLQSWNGISYNGYSAIVPTERPTPNNINAPSYYRETSYVVPYMLHYKLATPIPNHPIQTEGSLETFAGNCTVALGEGVVVREVAHPNLNSAGDAYFLNSLDEGASVYSPFKYRLDSLIAIYKDTEKDNFWQESSWYPNGKHAYTCPVAHYDPSAAYTVTYLAEPYQISASALNAELTYATNISTVLQKTVEELNNAKTLISILENEKANKKQPPWFYPTMLNGWISDSANARPIRYCKNEFGMVLIEGVAYSGTKTDGIKVFRVDSKCRPDGNLVFSKVTELFEPFHLVISEDGYVAVYGLSSGNWIYIAGCVYRAKE